MGLQRQTMSVYAGLRRGALFIFLNGPLVHAASEIQDLAARRRFARIDVPNEHNIQVLPARPPQDQT